MSHRADGPADPVETWALVPLRGLEAAKSRLGGQLDAEERLDLVTGLLERTLAAATGCPLVDRVLLVSPDPAALELGSRIGVEVLREPGRGLNAALDAGRDHAVAAGAVTLLILPADLPRVSPEAIARMITGAEAARARGAAGRGGLVTEHRSGAAAQRADRDGPGAVRGVVALVPDRHGGGTNALLVSPPGIIPFAFGHGSRARHEAAARAAGAAYVELDGELGLDVDTPEDLLLAEVALSPLEHVTAAHHGSPLEP